LCRGRVSYRTTHTFASAQNGALTVPVGVVRTFARRRNGRRFTQWLVYVLLRVPPTLSLPQVRQRYRWRFGIESSYRLLEQVRARTTSPPANLRFLLMGLALVLCNLWIALHWRFLRRKGSGPRRVAREHFPLERMARFLSRAVEAIYGVVSCICPPNVKNGIY
jgi:IS4 transposase